MKQNILITIACVFCLCGQLNAQSKPEPTLQETLDFLKSKTMNRRIHYGYGEFYCSEFSYNSIYKEIHFTKIVVGGENHYHCIKVENLTGIFQSGSEIHLNPYTKIMCDFTDYGSNAHKKRFGAVYPIDYGSEGEADRVYKAWIHLMKLLGVRLKENEERERQAQRNKEVDNLFR